MNDNRTPTGLGGGELASSGKVLFLPSHAASLKEMLFLAAYLAGQRGYKCVFVIAWPCSEDWLQRVEQAGHTLDHLAPQAVKPKGRAHQTVEQPNDIEKSPRRSKVRDSVLNSVARTWKQWRRFGKVVRQADSLLAKHRPDVIVTPSDRLIGLQTAVLTRAESRGVPTLVIPWSVSDPAGQRFLRLRNPAWESEYGMKRWINRYAAGRFPRCATICEGRQLLFLQGETLLAAHWRGILPPTPWGLAGGGGLATRVAVEGQRVFQHAQRTGVDEDRLALTGRASTDVLFAAQQQAPLNRRRWLERMGASEHDRILLCAVPQLGEHGLCSWEQHWQEVHHLFDRLSQVPDCRLLLSLHPKSDPQDYVEIAKQYGAVLAAEPIEHLLPVADLFVSTISSTIVMAIGCHVPTIILDIYGMGYDIYTACSGTVTVKTKDALQQQLDAIMRDDAEHQRLVNENRQTAAEWIQMDGKCSQRLTDLIDNMIRNTSMQMTTRKAA